MSKHNNNMILYNMSASPGRRVVCTNVKIHGHSCHTITVLLCSTLLITDLYNIFVSISLHSLISFVLVSLYLVVLYCRELPMEFMSNFIFSQNEICFKSFSKSFIVFEGILTIKINFTSISHPHQSDYIIFIATKSSVRVI